MQYRLQITYFDQDEKPVTLILHKDQMGEFFHKLKDNNPYVNESTNVGFWTAMDKIRHIIITKQQEEAIIEKVAESSEDSGDVQKGEENPE